MEKNRNVNFTDLSGQNNSGLSAGNASGGQHPDYQKELLALLRSGMSPKLLKEEIRNYHENDIADVLEQLSREERARLYCLLDAQTLSDVLEYTDDFALYFSELGVRKQSEILSHLETDTAVEYLRQLNKTERATLIDLMDDETRRDIALIGSFDEDEIGSRMTTNYIRIQTGISVRQAMRELVDQAAENDNVSTIYVTDADQTFCGAIDLKDLIIARDGTELEEIIATSYPYVYAQEQTEECIERLRDYSEDSIPVLDNENRLIGVITSQDIVELVDEAMGEDYAKLAGLSAEEDMEEPLKKSISKRLPWLIVLLGLGMVVSSVVGLFEGIVAQLTILVSFQSLVLDMAGNVGTQSLAVTIRVLMDEQITGKQKLALIAKETRVGALNGIVLAAASLLLIGAYICLIKGRTPGFAFAVSACIGIALLISMTLSSVAGTTIPILFKKIKIDPAVASGPLITTVNDLVAAVSYYGLAWLLLIQFLGL